MKTIAIKVEAGLKRLVSDLAGLESSELELLALKDELLNAGANADIVAEAEDALTEMIAKTKRVRALYLIVHGVAQKALEVDPTIPQPRSGT